jgi:membrane-associated protease RseP (regulator of RpoE activity)
MENFGNQNIEKDSYKTGSTNPPKNRGGLVAGLLIAVILLAGVSSILGVMNIQLFRMLQKDRGNDISFVPNETSAGQPIEGTGRSKLGLTAGDISEADRRYFHLPAGVLIAEVEKQGCAAAAGLAPGDIILSVDGTIVLTAADLEQVMQNYRAGDRVEIKFYRYRTGAKQSTTVVLEEAKG